MRRLLPALLLCPLLTRSQEVQPVISPGYLQLIRQDAARRAGNDAAAPKPLRQTFFPLRLPFRGQYRVGRIVLDKSGYQLQPYRSKVIRLGGAYSTTAAVKTANRIPALQSGFAQGRNLNGSLQWRGPETGELFSYGPALATLEYDHTPYPYDQNGRLVPAGMGNGRKANTYNNQVIRTGSYFEQSLTFRARYLVNEADKITGHFRFTRGVENLIVSDNRSVRDDLAATAASYFPKMTLTVNYLASWDRLPTSNRFGLLNRAYQQSLLTPASFGNGQGYELAGGQRSYSPAGDNPWFLLQDNGNDYQRSHTTVGMVLDKNVGNLRFKVKQSAGSTRQSGREQYKPGTAYFPAGQLVQRTQRDEQYTTGAELSYFQRTNEVEMEPKFLYTFHTQRSAIGYLPGASYRYQRTSNDLSVGYQVKARPGDVEVGGGVLNKLYFSNTSSRPGWWLPAANAFVKVWNLHHLDIAFSGSYSRFLSELPIDRSLSHTTLLNLPASEALRFFPVTEVESFDKLDPIRHEEWTAKIEATYRNRFRLRAEYFSRTSMDDVFPQLSGNRLLLQNVADHRNRGLELSLSMFPYYFYGNTNKITVQSELSLFTYQDKVLQLANGLSQVAIAGFSDVNKVLVPGQVVGAIAGSHYLRNDNNNIVIGDDGFPLVSNTPAIIGNPIPDFVVKCSNTVRWKNFSFTADLEWKKGGDVWNGTQAVLDYYGRSARSATLRATTGYVFPGVLANGHVNTKPVAFYDVRRPLEENRWVRYGYGGVAEAYVQKGDYLRLPSINLTYRFRSKHKLPDILVGVSAHNLLLWTPYEGGDPAQLLLEQDRSEGIDYFNLPSARSLSLQVSLQF